MNYTNFLKTLKNHINNNKKNFVISVIFAIILTTLTPHLWIKSKYWENHFTVTFPNAVLVTITTKSTYDKTSCNKSILPYFNTNEKIRNKVYVSKQKNNLKNFTYMLHFAPNSSLQTYNNYFIESKSALPITFLLPEDIQFDTFKINNVDYIDKFCNNSYTYNPKKNESLNISFSAKLKIDKNIKLKNNISILAFLITFIVYLIIIQTLILKKVVINYQYLLIFLLFFILYMLNNRYAIYNTCYTYEGDIFWGGDTHHAIKSIMYSISRQKHSFAFLPFYTCFDILLLLTKNFTLSLMIIFSSISALSVTCLYKLLNLITSNTKKINLLLTFIYGFSYTLLSIYYCFETYSITGLFLIILIIYLVKEFQTKEYNYSNMFFIILVTTLLYGTTTSNIFTSLILISSIFIYKKNKKAILIFCLSLFLLMSSFKTFQSLTSSKNAWTSARIMTSDHLRWIKPNKKYYLNQVIKSPLLAQNNNYTKKTTNSFYGFFILLNLITILILLKNKKYNADERIFTTIFLALIFNLVGHYYWYPKEGFLFSQNYFSLWFIDIAYCLYFISQELKTKNIKLNHALIIILLLTFLGIEIPNNYISSQNFQNKTMKKYPLTTPILEVKK